MRRLLVLGLCVLPILVGCGSGSKPVAGRGNLSRAELAWIRTYVRWTQVYAVRQGTPGSLPTAAAARRTLAPYRDCARSFGRDVDAAPTTRLARVVKLQRQACAAWAGYARATTRFLRNDFSAGIALEEAQSTATHAQLLADDVIDRRLRESRALPQRSAATTSSRIDARYGQVASELTSIPTEVRCWSDKDWPHVLSEAAAYTSVDGREEGDVLAFASQVHNRINLSPEVCVPLDALVYGRERPSGGIKAAQVANAIYVLAHESAHVSGIVDESLASCRGIQDTPSVAKLFGIDAPYGHALADEYWREQYTQQPARYLTLYCGPDRPLDRTPGDGIWP